VGALPGLCFGADRVARPTKQRLPPGKREPVEEGGEGPWNGEDVVRILTGKVEGAAFRPGGTDRFAVESKVGMDHEGGMAAT